MTLPPAPSRNLLPPSPRKAPGTLRLHYDPASTTCRPIILFATENAIPLDYQLVDLFSDENRSDWYTRLNANQAVPVLQHDDFLLTESSAILKYLADLTDSPAYPKDLRERARVNEVMDFFNTYMMRDYVYGLVYARVLTISACPRLRISNTSPCTSRVRSAASRRWIRGSAPSHSSAATASRSRTISARASSRRAS